MKQVVARVNGMEISREAFDDAVARYIVQLEEDSTCDFEPTEDNLKFIKTEVLNQVIDRTLLLQAAENEKTDVSKESILENLKSMRENFEDEEEWKKNLVALHIKEENLYDNIRQDMIIDRYLNDNFNGNLNITNAELKDYYDRNEKFMKEPDLFSFLEIYSENAGEVKLTYKIIEKENSIDLIQKELKSEGLSPHYHSEIPSYNLPAEVFSVLSDLEVGKIGTMPGPDDGIIVYKLTGKVPGQKLIFEDIKEKLAEYLVQASKNESIDKLINAQRDKAVIEYVDADYLKH